MNTFDFSKDVARPVAKVVQVLARTSQIKLPYKDIVVEIHKNEGDVCLWEGEYKTDKEKVDDKGKFVKNRDKRSSNSFFVNLSQLEKLREGAAEELLKARVKSLQTALKWIQDNGVTVTPKDQV